MPLVDSIYVQGWWAQHFVQGASLTGRGRPLDRPEFP